MDLSFLQGLLDEHTYTTLCASVAAICGCAAWICTLLPAPDAQSGRVYRALYALLNLLGANKGKAANADDVARARRFL